MGGSTRLSVLGLFWLSYAAFAITAYVLGFEVAVAALREVQFTMLMAIP